MGTVISINSFRGGTGKSTITVNIAATLAMADYRVGIVDSDFISPSMFVHFGLDRENMGYTLSEYLRGECELKEVAHRVGTYHNNDPGLKILQTKELWFLPSSLDKRNINEVSKHIIDINKLNAALQTFRRLFQLDYLFIDTHPGIYEEVLLNIAFSDILIIVLRPSQQDAQGNSVLVEIAKSLAVPKMYLVVNQSLSRYDPKQVEEAIEKPLEAPVLGVLDLSEDIIAHSYNNTSSIFSLKYPDHPWSRKIKEMAIRLSEHN